MITREELAAQGEKMRELQIRFFRTRDRSLVAEAQIEEKKFDRMLDDIRKESQPDLFK